MQESSCGKRAGDVVDSKATQCVAALGVFKRTPVSCIQGCTTSRVFCNDSFVRIICFYAVHANAINLSAPSPLAGPYSVRYFYALSLIFQKAVGPAGP